MKKEYISPTVIIMHLDSSELVCAATSTTTFNSVQQDNVESDASSYRNNLWN